MKIRVGFLCCLVAVAASSASALQVNEVKQGAAKVTVSVQVGGSPDYVKALKRNLELSGWFKVAPSGSISVTGTAGGTVTATGRGRSVSSSEAFSDAAGARMAARKMSDAIVNGFSDGGKGFATKRIAYVNRKGSDNAELYMCYPDGWDMRQITNDGRAAIGPRWAFNGRDLYYTGFLHEKQLSYRIDVETERRECLGCFKNGASGAAASNAAVESDVLPMLIVTSLASPTAIRQHAASAAIPAHRTGFFFCTGSSARAIRSSPTSPMARKSFSSLIRRSPPLRGTCAAFRASGTGWTSPCFPSCHTGLR